MVVGMIFISYLLGLRSQIKFREIFENLILITNKQQIDSYVIDLKKDFDDKKLTTSSSQGIFDTTDVPSELKEQLFGYTF